MAATRYPKGLVGYAKSKKCNVATIDLGGLMTWQGIVTNAMQLRLIEVMKACEADHPAESTQRGMLGISDEPDPPRPDQPSIPGTVPAFDPMHATGAVPVEPEAEPAPAVKPKKR